MTASVSQLPFSLDPLMAEAKRRMHRRRVLVAVVLLLAAAAATGISLTRPWSGGGAARHYTFAVKAVNSSRVVNDVSFVALGSPVALSRKRLTRTPLFDIAGGFYLTKTRARGSVLCSFAKRITDSATFPTANGKTVTVKVYGRRISPLLTARICTAFETFSLSYRH